MTYNDVMLTDNDVMLKEVKINKVGGLRIEAHHSNKTKLAIAIALYKLLLSL